MEPTNLSFPWLELIDRPAFCVKDGVITAVNSAAKHQLLQTGTDIHEIVSDHFSQYASFENGSLHLPITAGGVTRNATVTRTKEYDIFLLDPSADDAQLQALTLAAKQLRIPLTNIMLVADRLLSKLDAEDASSQQQANLMNQGLFQILRIISNMSDAGAYQQQDQKYMETVNLTAVIDEVMEKIQTTLTGSPIQLHYTSLDPVVFGLANPEKIERAVYNLLSNAAKFTPPGGSITAELTANGNFLSFTVCNTTADASIGQNFWNRYQREPAIEESRFGLGLGMTLVQAVAASHGGTVLIDHPASDKTRVTMTIAIQNNNSGNLHSPIMRIGDYAGGRDKSLLELSEFLPSTAYEDLY